MEAYHYLKFFERVIQVSELLKDNDFMIHSSMYRASSGADGIGIKPYANVLNELLLLES